MCQGRFRTLEGGKDGSADSPRTTVVLCVWNEPTRRRGLVRAPARSKESKPVSQRVKDLSASCGRRHEGPDKEGRKQTSAEEKRKD